MIINTLNCHTKTECSVIQSVHVEVEAIPEGGLRLQYLLRGQLAMLRIPESLPAISTDGLSEHTCFEAFIGVEGEPSYHEFNFSPSGQWAAYAFSDYRTPDKWTFSQSLYCLVTRSEKYLLLEATIPGTDLPPNVMGKTLQLGLTAVFEAENGTRSYWALQHPTDRPNFHHRAGFACILKPGNPDEFPFINKEAEMIPEPS